MSETYVTLKVREALKAAGGSRGQAQRILTAMALDDEQLLRGLAQPFLKAIVASAIERAVRGAASTRPAASPSSPVAPGAPVLRSTQMRSQRKLSAAALDALVSQMGQAAPAAPAPKTAAPADDAADQANALKALAAAFRGRR